MKTYDELSAKDKKKLEAYWTVKKPLVTRVLFLVGLAYIGVFIGIPLLVIGYGPMVLGAICLFTIGLVLVIIAWQDINDTNKYLQLAFGTNDAMKDIFKIKKSDIKNMKMVLKKE